MRENTSALAVQVKSLLEKKSFHVLLMSGRLSIEINRNEKKLVGFVLLKIIFCTHKLAWCLKHQTVVLIGYCCVVLIITCVYSKESEFFFCFVAGQ